MGLKAGIDLGTTNSVIYVLVNEQWVLVKDQFKRPTVPSVVWQAPGAQPVVGGAAKARIGGSPAPVIEVKRNIGTDKRVELGGKLLTSTEVSAIILRYLKELAEGFVRQNYPGIPSTITDVVVTHPARFGFAARTETIRAARMAGFVSVVALPEPIAAALAYTQRARAQGETPADQRILVYDLGGGTFDVTILERHDQGRQIDVLEYGGDEWLGGSDFDQRLVGFIHEHLSAQNYVLGDLNERTPETELIFQKLKQAAESIKIELTSSEVVVRATPNLLADANGTPVDLDITVTRAQFEGLTKDLLDRSLTLTHRALARQGFTDGRKLSDEELDALSDEALRARSRANARHVEVMLAGSSCWMPMVAQRLTLELGRECKLVDPAIIIAEGAAIRALSGTGTTGEVEWRPTAVAGIEIAFAPPRSTARSKRVPIRGSLKGAPAGCRAILTDQSGQEHLRALGDKLTFVFQCDLDRQANNEFTLRVEDPSASDIFFEEAFAIRHDDSLPPAVAVIESLALDIKVQTKKGFLVLFPAYSKFPVEQSLPTLLTPDASGTFRIPFYEGDRFQDEIMVRGAPTQAGVPIVLTARLNAQYEITARVDVDGTATALTTAEIAIKPRSLRSIDVIIEHVDDLRRRFENQLQNVNENSRRIRLRTKWQRLQAQLDAALGEERAEIGHLEELVAAMQMVVDEAGMLPQLEPTWDHLKEEMDERRSHARNPADASTLDDLLVEAKRAWDAQDADAWKRGVDACRDLTHGWEPREDPNTPPPTPEELKKIDLRALDSIRETIEEWGPQEAAARDDMVRRLDEACTKVESARGDEAYDVHNDYIVPLFKRAKAGPPKRQSQVPERVDSK